MDHQHTPTIMHMRATRQDVERLVARCNADPRVRGAKIILEGNEIKVVCPRCEQPIAITVVEFVDGGS